MKFFLSIGNALTVFLLRSPIHGILSRAFLLITVTGRKSGKQYTTPINYARTGDKLIAISQTNRTWWRNLRGGAPVTVGLQGKRVEAQAEAFTADEHPILDEVTAYYQQIAPGRFPPEQVAQTISEKVLIIIHLEK